MEPRPFSEGAIKLAWGRCGSRCECVDQSHGHQDRCNQPLNYRNPGREGLGCWEAHHVNPLVGNFTDNCQILCWNCHSQTFD